MKKLVLILFIIGVTAGGCSLVFRTTVVFDNYDLSNSYDCYIDGFYEGTVGAFGRLYVHDVSIGTHVLEAEEVGDGLPYYSDLYYVRVGTNYWALGL